MPVSASKKVIRKKKVEEEKPVAANIVSDITAYIPPTSVRDSYVPRRVNGVWDMDLLDYGMTMARNILLLGDTGAGKTRVGSAFAAERQCLYYTLPCDVSIDPSAFIGKLMPLADGGFGWVDGPVTSIVRGPCGLGSECEDDECVAGVLNISEVNFMSPKIASSLYSLLDSRRQLILLANQGEIITAHHNLLIIADMNPNYRGTQQLNAAFQNRFPIQVQWGYEDKVEAKLVQSASLRKLAGQLRAQYGREIRTPVGTNKLMEFEEFALDSSLGLEFAIANFITAFQPDEQSAVAQIFKLNAKEVGEEFEALRKAQEDAELDEEISTLAEDEEEADAGFEEIDFEDMEFEEDDE